MDEGGYGLGYDSWRFLNFGEVNTEFILGRRVLNSVSMYLQVEFLIMEAVLEHPWRTLAEIVHDMNCMSKQDVNMLWKDYFIT